MVWVGAVEGGNEWLRPVGNLVGNPVGNLVGNPVGNLVGNPVGNLFLWGKMNSCMRD